MASEKIKRNRAVVTGGSIAGKLAARVLSEFFKEVIVIEKDNSPDKIMNRKGVPQSAHGHVLLKSGEEILEEFFPGIMEELSQIGAKKSDFAADLVWSHHGNQKIRFASNVFISQQSRPLLERQIQKRLERVSNIHFRFGCKVKSLLMDRNEIHRVIFEDEKGLITKISADLIIDASGAATLHNQWLQDSGCSIPPKTEVKVDLFYASMVYKGFSPGSMDWHSLLAYPYPPEIDRGGTISPIEGNRMLVTLIGYGIKDVPHDADSFMRYAKSLEQPELYEVIKNELPYSQKVEVYRFPALRRYHLEKLKGFPSGLLVMGDAICRIDPVFAQGMSLAAMEAKALKELLKKETTKKQLTKSYHKKVGKILAIPWLIALTEDFRFRTTSGRKPLGLSMLQWFVKNIVAASSHNQDVYTQFIQVLHLKKHPIHLARPDILAKVFRAYK